MSKLLGRFQALESDVSDTTATDNIEVDSAGAPLDISETAEETILDAAEVEAPVIEEAEGEVDELSQAHEALENWLDYVGEARQEGGLTKREAKGVFIGIGNTLAPLGVSCESMIGYGVSSLEDFGGSLAQSNTISVENAIVNALQSVWQAIKNAISKLVTYVRDWYLKNWDGASRMKRKAEAIRDKANNTNGTAEKKKIPIPGMAQLHIGKAVPTSAQIISSLETARNVASNNLSARQANDYKDGLEKLVTNVENIKISHGTVLDQGHGTGISKPLEKLKPVLTGVDQTPDKAAERFSGLGDSSQVKCTAELCGGRSIMGYAPNVGPNKSATGDDEASEVIKKASQAFLDVRDYADKKIEVDSGKEGDVLKTSEVGNIATAVIKAMDVIIEFKAAYNNHEKGTKEFITKMDKVVKGAKAEDDSADEKARVRVIRTAANGSSQLIRAQNRTITSLTGYLLGTSRAALNYCNSSLNQYKAA